MAVTDITHLLDEEQGSAFDQDSLMFGSYDGGSVFSYDQTSFARDMREMLRGDAPDPKAQTLESVLSLPIRSAPFYLNQGRASDAVYERINTILLEPSTNGGMSTSMNLIVAQMCNAFVYKKAFFEKVWTEMAGGVGFKKVAWRPSTTCAIERDPNTGSFMGFRQMPIRMDNTDEKVFNPDRAFVYIHGTHRDPMEGVSDLHVTQWCYRTKQKIRFLWYQFLEGQSLPKTIVKATDETEATEAAKKIIGLRSGGVVGLSDRITADPLESSGRGAAEFKAAMQWLDSEASSSVMAGFTDLGAAAAGGAGSFALSKDQTDFFLMSREAEKREMREHINQFLIGNLMKWNFPPGEIAPTFDFGPINQDDASSAIALLQATAQTPVNQSVLPQEFFDELTLRVAGFLELDVVTVREGLTRAKEEAERRAKADPNPAVAEAAEVAGAAAAVTKATEMVSSNAPSNATQQQAVGRTRAPAV